MDTPGSVGTVGTAELQLGTPTDVTSGKEDAELELGGPGLGGPGWHSRGYLPHVDAEGLIQHLTFHLADSLPAGAMAQLEQSIATMPEGERKRQRRERYQALLDAGHGSCVLGEAEPARLVQDALLHFDGERYRLLAWVVMPNHVHVLIEPASGCRVAKIVQSWKSFTGRRIGEWVRKREGDPGTGEPGTADPGTAELQLGKPENCRAGARRSQAHRSGGQHSQAHRSRGVWQRDYWDRYIRNDRHLAAARRYIEENPVAAGLVAAPEEWLWGSARWREGGK